MNRLSPKNSVTKTWTGHSLYKTSLFSIKFFVCKTGCLSPCRFFDMIMKIGIIVYKTFEALSKVLKVSPFPLPPLSSKTGCFKNKIRFNFVCSPLLKGNGTGSLSFPEKRLWFRTQKVESLKSSGLYGFINRIETGFPIFIAARYVQKPVVFKKSTPVAVWYFLSFKDFRSIIVSFCSFL